MDKMRIRRLVLIAAATLISACNSSSPPKATAGTLISMAPMAWQIRYSPGMPLQPTAYTGGGWQFDFPTNTETPSPCPAAATQPPDFNVSPCHHVDYVTIPYTAPITAKSLTVTFDIVAQSPVYDYRTAANNTCTTPASVRLLLEHSGDAALTNPVYRWWSTTDHQLQTAGTSLSLTIPLTADQWTDVDGQAGTANTAAFADTLANIGDIGMTFGGGCFYGHGVYLDSGNAAFFVRNFTLN
jgi:hypothetical protein